MTAQEQPQNKWRAQVSVRYDKHTIRDTVTGDTFELDPEPAWKKFRELNGLSR